MGGQALYHREGKLSWAVPVCCAETDHGQFHHHAACSSLGLSSTSVSTRQAESPNSRGYENAHHTRSSESALRNIWSPEIDPNIASGLSPAKKRADRPQSRSGQFETRVGLAKPPDSALGRGTEISHQNLGLETPTRIRSPVSTIHLALGTIWHFIRPTRFSHQCLASSNPFIPQDVISLQVHQTGSKPPRALGDCSAQFPTYSRPGKGAPCCKSVRAIVILSTEK